ncbi:hypothetical protein [Cylindrospermopsis raciborskii]|nr:hypothetical protein [Cylindrospermopsis raciborskii]
MQFFRNAYIIKCTVYQKDMEDIQSVTISIGDAAKELEVSVDTIRR